MSNRLFWPLAAAILAALGAVQFLSAIQENQTWDEGIHLSAGYSYWKTGDFRLDPEHPPLAKLLTSSPLLFLNPELPVGDESWAKADTFAFSTRFLYSNRVPTDTMLLVSRSVTIFATLCLGLAIVWWARSRFSPGVALLSLLLYAFEPAIIAHGRYVTTDLIPVLFAFLAFIAWISYLEHGGFARLGITGMVLGLALSGKHSAMFLVPAFVIVYVAFWLRNRSRDGRFGLVHAAGSFALVLVVAAGVIVAVYAPEAYKLVPVTRRARLANPQIALLRERVDQSTRAGKVLAWAGARLGFQDHTYLMGLAQVAHHSDGGHDAYLLGRYAKTGWWYYFPIAFAVKTPVGTLAFLALALALAVLQWRKLKFDELLLLIPIATFAAFSMSSGLNIGIRHILPIYPFLFLLISAVALGASWKWRDGVVAALGALLVVESLWVFPNYLAFFNFLVGGPGNGPKYLVDSNLDWGQDIKKLKKFMVAHQISRACIAYFGTAQMRYYGVEEAALPETGDAKEWDAVDCVVAVSATPLQGVYNPPERFARLRAMKPAAKIGYSIYVYDLRKTPSAPLK